jgi:hypothetical protein
LATIHSFPIRWFLISSSTASVALFLLATAACSGQEVPSQDVLSEPAESGPRCPVELVEVAAYQTVEVALGHGDRPVTARNADIVANKPMVVRAKVRAEAAAPTDVSLRVHWHTGDENLTLIQERPRAPTTQAPTFVAPSSVPNAGPADDADTKVFEFALPATAVTSDAAFSVELATPTCTDLPNARFPRTGTLPLSPIDTGTLRVRLVPVRYDADGSQRLPDISAAQLAAFRAALLAAFPVAEVEITVRAPVVTTTPLEATTGWNGLLDLIRHTRAQDRTPADVYDFGLVAPAPSHAEFCGTGCVTGISFTPSSPRRADLRASAGLGFPGPLAAEIMLHELGHAHGRSHAPCGTPKNPDPDFPYPEALIGVWGYDQRNSDPLRSPTITRDIMSYCGPRWVSDYTYRGLTNRIRLVNRTTTTTASRLIAEAPAGAPSSWRALLVDAKGKSRWGLPVEVMPEEPSQWAALRDASGASIGQIEVHVIDTADSDEQTYWIAATESDAHSFVLPNSEPVLFPL